MVRVPGWGQLEVRGFRGGHLLPHLPDCVRQGSFPHETPRGKQGKAPAAKVKGNNKCNCIKLKKLRASKETIDLWTGKKTFVNHISNKGLTLRRCKDLLLNKRN